MCLFTPGTKISTCVSSDQLWLHLTPPLCMQINTGTSIFFFLIKRNRNKLTHKHTSHTQGHTQRTYLHIYNIYIQNPRPPKDRGTTHPYLQGAIQIHLVSSSRANNFKEFFSLFSLRAKLTFLAHFSSVGYTVSPSAISICEYKT